MNKIQFHVCTKDTKSYIENSQDDLIVLVIPFSDPIAEDPDIQTACTQSLNDGFTLKGLFESLKTLKSHPHLVFKTYANVIHSYGKEKFMVLCQEAGILGLIIPDLPYEEKEEFLETCIHYNVSLIPIIASNSLQRIKKIVSNSTPYVYLSCRAQDDENKAIYEIQKHTNAIIIKR